MDKSTIFKRASTTYYYSSIFFPPKVRADVFTLYAFVRTADDLVDVVPPKKRAFQQFVSDTWNAWKHREVANEIITDFVALCHRVGIKRNWVESFLEAMQQDLTVKVYPTQRKLDGYMFGSAEVIGLMMCAILRIPTTAYRYAQLQGKAMQLVNFIRDVAEDQALGRTYIKSDEQSLRQAIMRYRLIQREASKGNIYIPYLYRIPIMTAASLYEWTTKQIEADPSIVWRSKVKPTKWRVIATVMRMSIQGLFV